MAIRWIGPLSTPQADEPEPLRGVDWVVQRTGDGKYFLVEGWGLRNIPGDPGDPAILVYLATRRGVRRSEPLDFLVGEEARGNGLGERIEEAIEAISDEDINRRAFEGSD